MRPRWSTQTKSWAEVALIAVVAYVPVLLSSPGRVSADSKQALLVDPASFLAGASSLWDPGTGAGTVPHQHLGYLWPMGPWFWLFDAVGVPTWVAQRLWLGTLVLVAGLGVRWLLRSFGLSAGAALVGALVYAASPYQLAFTARMSVILLPWAGLPWLVELTRRSARAGGWRHPALFGLVLVSTAGVNATSLVLVGLGPALLLVWFAAGGARRAAVSAGLRLTLVSLGVSAWWLVGLRVQGAYGMPVLQLTENLSDVARWSSPADVLRGLGNWFFAGRDRLGYSLDQAGSYLDSRRGVAVTLVLPSIALAGLILLRGRLRLLAALWVVVGSVVAVGAWPIDEPSPYGRAFRWLTEETTVGLAVRNSHRIVPLLVLGMALVVAVAIDRIPPPSWRLPAGVACAAAALAMLVPTLPSGLLSDHVDRPEAIPVHWVETAALLDERATDPVGNPWRVLEIPGSPFAAYRWGNTVEPVLPALMDRPQVAREVLPYGSAATANLLDAFDRRIQEGLFEPDSLSPIARLFAASDVVVRNDLQWERFRAPEPRSLWSTLTRPLPPGVVGIDEIGDPVDGPTDPALAPIDERQLAGTAPSGVEPPAVAVLRVEETLPILRALPDQQPVIVAGDGEGLVDMAAAGLLDGSGLVHYADALDSDALGQALDRDAWLVVTDTNRRRIETWFYAIRDVRGPTERASETLVEPSRYDQRLVVFPHIDDRSRTVTEHVGGQVTATLSGGAARPEDRAMAAFDDDLATAWRVGGPDPVGHELSIELDTPAELDALVVVQPQDGPRDRQVEEIRLVLDDAEVLSVALDATSTEPEGQRISLGPRTVRRITVEIAAVSSPPFDPALANAVGFAEIRIPGVELAETTVLPSSLLERIGPASVEHGLDLVLTRLRRDPFERGRTDPERRLDRTVDMATSRTFRITGRARLSPDAPDAALDGLLGTGSSGDGTLVASASSRLAGDLGSRAWSAVDGQLDTAWRSAFGPQIVQWFEVGLDEPARIETVSTIWGDDEAHSMPRRIRVEVDGEVIGEHEVGSVDPSEGRSTVALPIDRDGVSTIRLTITDLERRSAPPGDPAPFATLPVALHELDLGPGQAAHGAAATAIDSGCRDDLVSVDGQPLTVRIVGPVDDARDGLEIDGCELLELGPGRHRLVAEAGFRSGIDLDRLVLSSAPGGGAADPEPRDRRGTAPSGPEVVEVDAGRTSWSAKVATDGGPFWLVMAQSHNAGWTATIDGSPLGAPTLVGGFANGWWVEPGDPGLLQVSLEWTPQRSVWWAIGLSLFAVGACLGLALGTERRPVPVELAADDRLGVDHTWRRTEVVDRVAVTVAVVGVAAFVTVISRPWIGLVAAGATVVMVVVPASRWVAAGLAPLALGAALLLDAGEAGWLPVALVIASVVGSALTERRAPLTPTPGVPRPASRESPAPRPTAPESARPGRDPGS